MRSEQPPEVHAGGERERKSTISFARAFARPPHSCRAPGRAPPAAPGVVGRGPPRSALAVPAARGRPVPRLAGRGDAPADAGRGGDPVLPALPRALAHARGAGAGRGRGRLRGLERPRVLRALQEPARGRPGGPAQRHGGLPPSLPALRALPGFGPYTAGAVASIAFALPAAAVDGNVARVLARALRDLEATGVRPAPAGAALGGGPRAGGRASAGRGAGRARQAPPSRATGTRRSWSWGRPSAGAPPPGPAARWPRCAPRAPPG